MVAWSGSGQRPEPAVHRASITSPPPVLVSTASIPGVLVGLTSAQVTGMVENSGRSTAQGVPVQVTLPAGVTAVDAVAEGWACAATTCTSTLTVGRGGSAGFSLSVLGDERAADPNPVPITVSVAGAPVLSQAVPVCADLWAQGRQYAVGDRVWHEDGWNYALRARTPGLIESLLRLLGADAGSRAVQQLWALPPGTDHPFWERTERCPAG